MSIHDPQTRTADATVTYHVENSRLTLQSLLDTALDRAVAAERERDALKIELARVRQDGRRLLFSLMKVLGVTMDDLLDWQIRQDAK